MRRLWRKPAGASVPSNASTPVWRSGHAQEIVWNNQSSLPLGGLNLAGARPPARTASFQSPAVPPGGALLLEPPAAAVWRNQTYSSQISITLVGLEARAVTKSETEAERLRAHARRSLELTRAIADQEASRAFARAGERTSERTPGARLRSDSLPARLQDGSRRNRLEATGIALPIWAFSRLVEVQES